LVDLGEAIARSQITGRHAVQKRHHQRHRGVDDRGRPVASGTYFCRLTADSTDLSRKMVLLK
jgi:hypothetical protein